MQTKKHQILMIDDHPFVRLGVMEAFKSCPDMEISWQAGLIIEAIHYLKTEKPAAIILDLSLKDQSGLEFLKDLQVQKNEIPILVLSVNDEDLFAERCITAGARGYLSKTASIQAVIASVRQIIGGEIAVSSHIAAQFINRLVSGKSASQKPDTTLDKINALSDREIEIFQMFGNGKSSKEIAATLKISANTVYTHRKRIMTKIGYCNSQEMIQFARMWVNDPKS